MHEVYTPSNVFEGTFSGQYMPSSIPVSTDFYHSRYSDFIKSIGHPFILHRKIWEFAFITEMLERSGVLSPGHKGIGFGCGTEPLPALFASRGCTILATDAPNNTSSLDWTSGNQYSTQVDDLRKPGIIDDKTFNARVSFLPADMNDISDDLRDFDFCWSACCLEHLGNIEKGLQFVRNSVEKTLKVGGFACHTTEFNLSSNDATLETDGLSIFRRRDIEALCDSLRQRGHNVSPVVLHLGPTHIDHHVDLPPFLDGIMHIKLKLAEYVCTSIGLLVQRGR